MSPLGNKRYQCKLSPELLNKAVKELNEPKDNDKRLQEIDTLRENFNNLKKDLKVKQDDDVFYLSFLRTAKFNQKRALNMMKNYHIQRSSWPEVFVKVSNPALIDNVLAVGEVLPLKAKASDGSTVIICRLGLGSEKLLINFLVNTILTLDKLLEDEDLQINGLTAIHDCSFSQGAFAKQLTPNLAKRFFGLVQDAMPVRVKSVNIVNNPRIFDVLYAMISPFFKDKLRKRFTIHGSDFTDLYKVVSKSDLPFTFAGSGPELDPLEWKEELLGNDTAL